MSLPKGKGYRNNPHGSGGRPRKLNFITFRTLTIPVSEALYNEVKQQAKSLQITIPDYIRLRLTTSAPTIPVITKPKAVIIKKKLPEKKISFSEFPENDDIPGSPYDRSEPLRATGTDILDDAFGPSDK